MDATQERPIADLSATERVVKALELRRVGHSYAEIALRCGYAHASNARKAIKKAEASAIRYSAQELIEQQLDQLDYALTQAVMPEIQKRNLWAVDRLVAICKRKAELMGLDAVRSDMPSVNVHRTYQIVRIP